MEESINRPQTNVPPVECPACGTDMRFTGDKEHSDITDTIGLIAKCPNCGNETLVSRSKEQDE